MEQPIFERYGGLAAITRLVLAMYDRVIASQRLAPYFAHVDMRRLVDHQAKFISSVMGGPTSYRNDQLDRMHQDIAIDDAAFDEMLAIFEATLRDFGYGAPDIEAILARLRDRRSYIVTGDSA